MTIAERLRKEGYDEAMLLLEKLQHEKYEKGIREGLLEAIELGLGVKFGDNSLIMMTHIRKIQDSDRLRFIKNAIKTAKEISEIRAIIEN